MSTDAAWRGRVAERVGGAEFDAPGGGYAFSNVLFYGTAGLAFGELRGQTFGWTESHTTAGWTIGAGAEVGLASNWSVKLEYLYIDLSTSQFAITGVSNGYSASVVRAGVNYRF